MTYHKKITDVQFAMFLIVNDEQAKQETSRIYQIVCEIVSPSLIINLLNKNIYQL